MSRAVELVHPRETLKVPVWKLVRECGLFADDPTLLCVPYSVRAPVSVDDFRQFVLALEGQDFEVTDANFGGLSLLCDEFCFESLSERLSAFQKSADLIEFARMEDSESRLRLSGLEELQQQRDHDFAALRQTQESIAVALTDATVRQNARIEGLEKRFRKRSQHC
jgi:hypothetical protein